MFPFFSFRLIGKSCISHTHSTFVGFFSIIIFLLFSLLASRRKWQKIYAGFRSYKYF